MQVGNYRGLPDMAKKKQTNTYTRKQKKPASSVVTFLPGPTELPPTVELSTVKLMRFST